MEYLVNNNINLLEELDLKSCKTQKELPFDFIFHIIIYA
jgi:hypothetical protein